MADRGQMDANLVRAPGHQPARQQACDRSPIGASIALQVLPMSYGFAALRMHGHFVAGVRMTADRGLDGALGPLQYPPYEGQVAPLHPARAAVIGELAGEAGVGAVG